MKIVEHASLLHAGEASGYMPRSCIAGSSGSVMPSFQDKSILCNVTDVHGEIINLVEDKKELHLGIIRITIVETSNTSSIENHGKNDI